MIKTKKQMYIIIASFFLIILLGTTTYAFFNYTRTGTANVIRTGQINFNSEQGTAINLTNLFPIDVSEGIPNDATKVGTVTINITGDTTYGEGIEYLVSAVNVTNTVGSKSLPISIDVSVASNTENSPATTLGTVSNDYYNDRGSTTSYYSVLASDVIENNEKLVVGYIAPGQTGVDGNIVIRAYLDKSKILISDTYPSGTVRNVITTNYSSSDCETILTGVTNASTYCATAASLQSAIDNSSLTAAQITLLVNAGIVEEYTDGTPASMAEGKTVLTTSEWNSLQANGVSFQVKVEANEGIWVENPNTLVNIMKRSTQLDTGLDFTQLSSYNNEGNGQGIYTLASSATSTNPIMYYRGAVTDNNVYFGGFCWQIVRTTETGGVKLIYNGANTGTSQEPKCESTGTGTQLSGTYNFSSVGLSISPAYNGYMWGTSYEWIEETLSSSIIYGRTFTYENGAYKLSAGDSGTVAAAYGNGRHYTCNSTNANATCENIRYYFNGSKYITLSGGESISQALDKMKTTGVKASDTNSLAKQTIDTWYSTNMTSYTNMLEDTIWCNDRTSINLGAWEESGNTTDSLNYSSNTRAKAGNPNLSCSDLVDSYTVSNTNGNGMLDYPVGMITTDEIILAGGKIYSSNSTFYLNTDQSYWTMSPDSFAINSANEFAMGSSGTLYSNYVNYPYGFRPMVSLKPGTAISSGTGLKTDPYIVE